MGGELRRIIVYPIKSLDGTAVESSEITARGGLAHDRRFAMRDATGRIVNAKRTPAVHRVRARYDLGAAEIEVSLSDGNASSRRFHLDDERDGLAHWLSEAIDVPLELDEDPDGGFPDDTDAAGPTVVSEAGLERVREWFPDRSLEEIRRRFRANLEIAGVPAFWEDRWVPERNTGGRRFQIGAVTLEGKKPCTRCVVPTRDPDSGAAASAFAKEFAARREAELPPEAPRARFDHFWRFTLNTWLDETQAGRVLRIGDSVA